MAIGVEFRPIELILLRLISHQVIVVTSLLLPKEGQYLFVILPVAVRHEDIITKVVHLSFVEIYRNKPRVLPSLLEPAVENHETLPVRTDHKMIDFVLGPIHGCIVPEGSEVCVLEQVFYFQMQVSSGQRTPFEASGRLL